MWGDAWEMIVKSDAFHVILNYESCFKSTGKYAAFKKQFARDISNVSSITNVRRHKRAYESSLIHMMQELVDSYDALLDSPGDFC